MQSLLEIHDGRRRLLVVVRTNRMPVMFRYRDMQQIDKAAVLAFFSCLREEGAAEDPSKIPSEAEILSFLNYEASDDICG
jgi:hypothetical protein